MMDSGSGRRGLSTRPWRLDVELGGSSNRPLYRQLADYLIADIKRGRLPPDSPLPGARSLAAELGVTRKVVSAALDELCAQGWLVTKPRSGTFVAKTLPAGALGALVQTATSLDGRTGAARPLHLNDGLPDVRLAPLESLSRAYRDATLRMAKGGLGYGDPRGDSVLRDVLSALLNQGRGLASTPEQVLLTRGSQMAFYLIAKVLAGDGGTIAIEDPGYPFARQAFSGAGASLVPVPVDRDGIDVERLAKLVQTTPLRAVYVTPHHQYPTAVGMSPERRHKLLALARAANFVILEDDYDSEFYFSPRPTLPLSAEGDWSHLVYIGSLSKLLAPGVRLGYLIGDTTYVERASKVRSAIERQGDSALERALGYLIEDGDLQRYARKARQVYAKRRNDFTAALGADPVLSSLLTFDVPCGGLALWLRVAPEVDVEAWATRAHEAGLEFAPGTVYSFSNRPIAALRAGFASLNSRELAGAFSLLRQTAPR